MRRAKALQAEKDADLKNAQDLLANVGMGPKTRAAPNKALIIEDKSNQDKPSTSPRYPYLLLPRDHSSIRSTSTLVPLLTALSNKPHYSLWLQEFVKKISADLPSAEIKKAASGLTALSNEKLKEEKAQDKTGKKSKAAKSKTTLAAGRDVGRGIADTTSYDDGLGDDDFM